MDLETGYEAWHDLCFFLAEAEILLWWGRTWRPQRAKAKPPLSGEAWHVPEGWEPPELQPGWPQTGRFHLLTLPEHLLHGLGRPGRPRNSGG